MSSQLDLVESLSESTKRRRQEEFRLLARQFEALKRDFLAQFGEIPRSDAPSGPPREVPVHSSNGAGGDSKSEGLRKRALELRDSSRILNERLEALAEISAFLRTRASLLYLACAAEFAVPESETKRSGTPLPESILSKRARAAERRTGARGTRRRRVATASRNG